MATKRLLVDAIHPEETRIVVTSGNRLEEFDFESATRRQLRGNIYLAKVTRVEPSLQAAFIEYGGNRHGFLAFSEIHPDYYQIPVADREALLRDEEAEEAENDRAEAADADKAEVSAPVEADAGAENGDEHDDHGGIEQAPAETEPVESVGSGDALEEIRERRRAPSHSRRNYKIQEVIKRRQVMLVQVVKEERGNKGAALTTYLSLAGRYSVLMPNTARGGGISRKITNAADRKRLKDIVGDLEIPQGQGIILRTAGASRTKAEVKRDFEYLQRLWENVRSLTLKSVAPCLVYEEGSLIKRTIRDLYSKDIDELYVAGDEAYREAKDFMRMIMPSHAKNVQLYKDDQPIFSKHGVESQLDSMFSPQVTLPSGGYIVINPTEALVSIDVNSGRSTKEHNIEDTALQTNLEAADEVARQLRLRDLAGLIVIDFIDMVENRSNRAVERKLKDCLKNDRARIQVGRISHFGLMEMSRQRIRFGVVESSTHKCPTCAGTGIVRSVESIALMVMRAVEDHVLRKPGQSINVKVPTDAALYILNGKRNTLNALEAKYQLSITIIADDHIPGAHYAIEKGEPRAFQADAPAPSHVRVDTASMEAFDADVPDEADEEEEPAEAAEKDDVATENGADRNGRKRRRRRGGRGTDRDSEPRPARVEAGEQASAPVAADGDTDDDESPEDAASASPRAEGDDGEPRKRRRRGRRGGRRNRRPENGEAGAEVGAQAGDEAGVVHGDADAGTDAAEAAPIAPADAGDDLPRTVEPETAQQVASALLGQDALAESAGLAPDAEPAAKPKRTRRKKVDAAEAPVAAPPAEEGDAAEEPKARPKRRGRAVKAAPPDEAEAIAAAESTTPDTVAASAPAEVEASAPADVAAAAPAEPASADPAPAAVAEKPRRKDIPEDEIIVSSTALKEGDEAPKPKRAGWWQRGFLGG